MQNSHASSDTARRVNLFNALAGVLAYPAALGFAWLWLIDGQHRGLLGFALIWLVVAGVYLRIYAQFLRWWHRLDYSAVWPNARISSSGTFNGGRRRLGSAQDEMLDLEERLLAAGAGARPELANTIAPNAVEAQAR